MTRRTRLSAAEARRIALAAQGFADRPPRGRVDRRHLRRVLDRVGLLQLDSVNVVTRAHYVPVFSRLGRYPTPLLDDVAWGRDAELFEYWGHEASLLPQAMHPLLRWRMARAARGEAWGSMVRVARDRPDYVADVLAAVAGRGPLRAADLDPAGTRCDETDPGQRGTWWDRSDAKSALEWLFWTGQVAVRRSQHFQRHYDLPERVLPAEILHTPTPSEDEAHRALLLRAARSLGVGTAHDLADYFRINIKLARERLTELVEAGELTLVAVEGWPHSAYLHPEARSPRRVEAQALLVPFDPLIWERSRVERLFGFRYRIEIYVPAPQRRWGYYVFPFLLGDRLVARVDVKADRAGGTLRVLGAFGEDGLRPATVAQPLAEELGAFAAWLGLDRVAVAERGDLAPALRRMTA